MAEKGRLSEENLIPFVELESSLEEMKFGTVSVWFQVHNGKIVSIQGNQFQQLRFPKNHNSEAMAVVLAEVKEAVEKKKSGNVTFTIKFGDGSIRNVFLQRNYRKVYP